MNSNEFKGLPVVFKIRYLYAHLDRDYWIIKVGA